MAIKAIADRCEASPRWELFTKSDSTNFAYGVSRTVYVGTGGDVAFVDTDGTAVVFPGVPSGSFVPVAAIRINSTSTTASGFVVMY